MKPPPFAMLMDRYPKSEIREVLYKQIGWDDVVNHPAYQDTCAIRMSIALASVGVPIFGTNMKIKAGPLKGQRIETGQGRLSHALKQLWGQPEVYKSETAANEGIGTRRGVVSFFRIRTLGIPTNGGHIDLVYPAGNGFRRCARSCFFDSAAVWFWPLQ
jgi:hypothetical protein